MKLEDIPQSILNTINIYEKQRDIETKEVIKIFQLDGIAYFKGLKSDGTNTLFIAVRLAGVRNLNRDLSWRWFAPDNEQTIALKKFPEIFANIEYQNRKTRGANQ